MPLGSSCLEQQYKFRKNEASKTISFMDGQNANQVGEEQ